MLSEKRRNMIDLADFASTKINSNRIILSRTDLSRDVKLERKNNAHTFKQSEIRNKIKNFVTSKSQEELVKISETLYVQSPQYNRLINYWSNLLTYDYVVVPKTFIDEENHDNILKDYKEISHFIDRANIRIVFSKILKKAFISDVFYGYVYVDKDNSLLVQQIPFELCKLTSVEDNVYNYAINLDELGRNVDMIPYYPQEIQKAYEKYVAIKKRDPQKAFKWYEIPSQNSLCIKINNAIPEIIPPFAGVFDSIYDINSFKDLRNDKAELDNYKLLIQKLPVRENSNENNDFIIDLPMMDYFHSMLEGVIPDNVGVATTPMKVETVTFDKDRVGSDGVVQATKDFWDSSGVSHSLFSGESTTAQAILKSIDVDEQYVFDILTQLSAWLNRFIKVHRISKYFQILLPDVTHFNRQEMIKMYLEQGQYGFPVKTYIAGLLGLSPLKMSGLLLIENEILDLTNKMKPFVTSYNTNSQDIKNKSGRPTNEESGKIDSDETSRSRDKSSTVVED